MLKRQRLPGLRADLRIAEPGIRGHRSKRTVWQERSAGEQRVDEIRWRWVPEYQQNNPACTRSQNPPTLKYVSGLVFGTAGAAGHPAALIPANLISTGPGWDTARITPALILHSKTAVAKSADPACISVKLNRSRPNKTGPRDACRLVCPLPGHKAAHNKWIGAQAYDPRTIR